MRRKEALDAAASCVLVDRNKSYGEPEDNFRITAQIMTSYLRGRGLLACDLAPHDVAALMISLKLARLCTSPAKEDTWVDLLGYAACGVECATADAAKGPQKPKLSNAMTALQARASRQATMDEIVNAAAAEIV